MGKLHIDQIVDLHSFERIRPDWEQLYQLDYNSHIYISWLWMYNWFSSASYKWVVLGVRNVDTSSYVAFLPLRFYDQRSFGIYPVRHVVYGGNPMSVYSGFLCSPDFDFAAIHHLAFFIQENLKWDIFHFKWIKDHRLAIFLKSFPQRKFQISEITSLSSLKITLPDSYETYLKNNLSGHARKNIKKRLKNIHKTEKYKITCSSKNTIDHDIEAICLLWFNHWQKKQEMQWHKNILYHFFKNDLLRLSMIWDGDTPVSALACILDPVTKTYNAYLTAFNPGYSHIAPGIVLFAKSIEQAIAQQYKYYDFTLGLDRYKLSFGPDKYETKNISIRRKSLKTAVTLILMKQMKKVIKRGFFCRFFVACKGV